jgi:hypothetical protein
MKKILNQRLKQRLLKLFLKSNLLENIRIIIFPIIAAKKNYEVHLVI